MTRRTSTAAVLLTLVAGLLAVAPSASALPGANTSWSMAGDHDEYVTAGRRWDYDASSGIQLSGTPTHLEGSVDGWTLVLEPAEGDVLAPGRTYDNATRWPFQEPGHPGEDLSGQGRGCNTSAGSFTVHDIGFDVTGHLTSATLSLTQVCGATQARAYLSIAWHSSLAAPPLPATTPAPPQPPSVSLKVPHTATYGQTIDAVTTLSTQAPVRDVAIYTRVAGGADTLVAQGPVDAAGHLTTPVRLTETTTITVRFRGTGGYADTAAERTVTVGARLRTLTYGGRHRARRHATFPVSAEPVVVGVLSPDHQGDCLRFQLQLRVRGVWGYDSHTTCLRLDERSAVGVRVPGDPRLVGIPVRVRPRWKGDERNPKVSGRWVYLRFVR